MIKIPRPQKRRAATKRLIELSGTPVLLCLQCGKCTAGCPFASEMDLAPHQLVHYAQLGLIEELSGCNAIWYCATCFTCQSRCPVEIDIAALSEAIRIIVLDEDDGKFDPDKIDRSKLVDVPQQALVSLFRKFSR
ncbi:MAG TPA: heterodisulfide reductase [Firmicutes bacterium]|nr:heterodisulfide reductase [Bacillota bacterium]